ncbi:uncharacterized protein C8A04DRAFT_11401 [Dichotomopilus funicola]|uniref:Uncharacterized protein n=1 Tax=Dichotomopilus funicola TaxID=1934379 RepID=A0AAN6V567_9PEZI|nr:hypothetical protein C8A04DRAFT_11401 [Dichotomopilus funicola]
MSFPPQFQSPGGFKVDAVTRPGEPLHANIFRPPSPTSSSYNLAKSTGSLLSDISMPNAPATGTMKRKRATMRDPTPLNWGMNMDGTYDSREEHRNQAFRYTLAGQISTSPAELPAGAENGLLEDSVYSDVDYRRALGPKAMLEAESPSDQTLPALDTVAPVASWSLLSLQTIGEMVGKVWEFCKKGAFRGFQAGGGQAYNMDGATVTETTGEKPWATEQDAPIQSAEETGMITNPTTYAPDPAPVLYSPEYHDPGPSEWSPQPAAKRRQVSANNDELRNWVVVDEAKAAGTRPYGPAQSRPGYHSQASVSGHRRISVPSQRFTGGTPTFPRTRARPSLHVSQTSSPSLAQREPASFASPRSSPVAGSTPSRIPVPIHHRRTHSSASNSAASSFNMGPAAGGASSATTMSVSNRRQSAKGPSDLHQKSTSPRLDAEARQLAQRKMAVERDTDAKVDAFNAQLLSMIRQGREALGTKVEVEMDVDEGGLGGEGEFGGYVYGEGDRGGYLGVGGGPRVGGGRTVSGGWEDDE